MAERKEYIETLKHWRGRKVIKVITGIRRCGKSTLLRLFMESLKQNGVPDSHCIFINMEDLRFEELKDYHKLYQYIIERMIDERMHYIFLDEIQLVPDFHLAVNSLFLKEQADLYITGSNAYLLPGELAVLLPGRYAEIHMLPLSFREYYELVGGEENAAFAAYCQQGGFPYGTLIKDPACQRDYLAGIYQTILIKDIAERKQILDVFLLEALIRYLADNIGNIVSAKKIADSLTSGGQKVSAETVETYLQALTDAFILYKAERCNVRGKQHLHPTAKYYLADVGFRSLLLGPRMRDVGRVLENIVYLELVRRGHRVSIGMVDELEVDFVAEKGGERTYYQVAASVAKVTAYEREFRSLERVNGSGEKVVLTMDEEVAGGEWGRGGERERDRGISWENVVSFLREK